MDRAIQDEPAGLWPFIPAGFPSLAATRALLGECAALPVRGIEIGFPYSDPTADGPVIREAFSAALTDGVRVQHVFEAIARSRPDCACPLIGMVSASIVYRIGVDRFVGDAAAAGLDGLIVPDLSVDEATALLAAVQRENLRYSPLAALTTSPARRQRIAGIASGFIYLVSVQGTTGARTSLPSDLAERVRTIQAETDKPVLVGFGISCREHVREVCRYANGAIVGSAIVQHLLEARRDLHTEASIIHSTVEFTRSLAAE